MQRITGANRPRGTLLILTPGTEAPTQKQGEAPPPVSPGSGVPGSGPPKRCLQRAQQGLGQEGRAPAPGQALPLPLRQPCEDPCLSAATDPTVNLSALCHTLSPQEPLGPAGVGSSPCPIHHLSTSRT